MKAYEYRNLRKRVISRGYRGDIAFYEKVEPPNCPDKFACEFTWVVLNSGMKSQIAETIWLKLRPVLFDGGSASKVFGHKGKAAAIDQVWRNREHYLYEFLQAEDKLAFCESLPWIGPITKYHLAKNFGVDCAKPDRWLVRVADKAGETVDALCARLAKATGDRIATVDYVIWRACNLGELKP